MHGGTYNLSYIYGNAYINIVYRYAMVFPILYIYIGEILCIPTQMSPLLYKKDFTWGMQNLSYNYVSGGILRGHYKYLF